MVLALHKTGCGVSNEISSRGRLSRLLALQSCLSREIFLCTSCLSVLALPKMLLSVSMSALASDWKENKKIFRIVFSSEKKVASPNENKKCKLKTPLLQNIKTRIQLWHRSALLLWLFFVHVAMDIWIFFKTTNFNIFSIINLQKLTNQENPNIQHYYTCYHYFKSFKQKSVSTKSNGD